MEIQAFDAGRRVIQSVAFSQRVSPPEIREGKGWTAPAAKKWAAARGYDVSEFTRGARNTLRLVQRAATDMQPGSIEAAPNADFPLGVSALVARCPGISAAVECADGPHDVDALEVRTEPGRAPRVRGYAAVFDDPATLWPGHKEIIRPGAFSRALEERQDVAALLNHSPEHLIGRSIVESGPGSLRLWEDDHGLAFEVEPTETSAGRDVVANVAAGIIRGASFGFRPVRAPERLEDGAMLREILDVDLIDVSPVVFPAYAGTTVTVALRAASQALEARAQASRERAAEGLPTPPAAAILQDADAVSRPHDGDGTPHRDNLERRLREITLSMLD